MKIVFVAPPFAGHLNPLVSLARAARDAGHHVRFVTGARKEPMLRGQGFVTDPLRSAGAERLEAIANTAERVGHHPLRLLRQFRENLALLPALHDELLTAWRAERPELVVADSVAPVAGAACETLGIPWITTIATPFAIENRRGVPAYCGGWGPESGVGSRTRNAAGRLAVRTFKRAVAAWFRAEFARVGLPSLYRADGTERIYSPRAILGFGMTELEFERDWPAAFRMIGPMIDAPEPCPPPVVPAAPHRVLVTLGTHLLWAKATLVERVTEIAAQCPDAEFVVSLGRPEDAGAAQERVARSVSVTPFVSYQRDLAAFDAVIHHGGTGALYAAILAGRPSLIVPHDYDQFDWAARAVHFGAAIRSETLDPAAVRALLARRDWPELRALRRRAATYRPLETFLETVAAVARAAR